MHRYPRDTRGHGPNPPDPAWPEGAAVAVSLVLNYEEGGENSILHGDAGSEAFLSDIAGAQAWPGQRHWNMESLYDYGARAGFWRLHRLLTTRGLPVTVFGVATALARSPEQTAAMQAAGWEIASHGLRWVEHRDMAVAEERAAIAEAVRLHTEVTGVRPRGWYTGRCSIETVRLVAQEGGFDWISDAYDDDLPHWIEVGDRDQLILPYTLEANDMRFSTAPGYVDGEQFFRYLKDSYDVLHAEGEAGAPKVLSIGLHCRLVGRPGRVSGLARFLDHVAAKGGAWFATRGEIAAHWAARHPHRRRDRPSRMDVETFTARFGGVYEHSPWIAARAHALELGPAHDGAVGLANALARIFRTASREERLGVLTAHPDLAGRLATARRLTAQSTSEQASAALDALTEAESRTFQRLNATYTARHGFPFVVAVRDHDKASILAEFEARTGNDTDAEFDRACREVERIATLRLREMLP